MATTTTTFSTSTQEMVAPPATAPINIQSTHFASVNPSLAESPGDSGYESSWPSLSEAAAWSPPPGQKRLASLKSDQDLPHFDGLSSSPFDKNTALLLSQPLVPRARYCSDNKKRNDKVQLQYAQGLAKTQEAHGQQQQQQQSTRQGKGQRRRARTQAYQAKRMAQLQAMPLVDLTSPVMEEDDPHNPDLGSMEPPIPLSVIPRGWLYEDVSSSLADDILIALPKREWIYESTGPMSMDAKSFVVMSWNLLSPRLCHPLRLDAGCEPDFLEWAYRRESILNQIAFTDADIVCLQELELRDYEEYFCPHMTRLGFKSIHAYKMNVYEMRDGCAIFYRDSRFKLINEHVLRFNQVELDDYNVKRASMARDTAIRFNLFHNLAIVALFENKRTKHQVQVATTHLLADPAFPDAKMLQTAILTSKLEELKAEAMVKLSSGSNSVNGHHGTTVTPQTTSGNNNNSNSSQSAQHIPTILAGDFNSLPDSSVVRFLKSGQVDTCHFGGNDFGRFTRAHSKYFYHRLGLADSYKSSILPFTNATRHFQGTIDYLLYDPSSLGLVGFMDHFEVDAVWTAANSTKLSGSEAGSSMSTSTANMSFSDVDSELEQDLVSSPSSSSLDLMSSPLFLARGKRAAKKALKKKKSHQRLDFSKLFSSDTPSTEASTPAKTSTTTKKDDIIPMRATLPKALPSQHFPSDHIPLVALFREREYVSAPSSCSSSQTSRQ